MRTALAIHIYCKWSSLLEIRVGCLDEYLSFIFSWRQSCVWLFIFWSFCIQAPSSILLVLLLYLCNRVLFASLQQTFDDRLSCYVGYPRVNQAYELHPGAGFLIIIIPIDRSYPSTMIFIPVATISYSLPGYSDLKHPLKRNGVKYMVKETFVFAFGSKSWIYLPQPTWAYSLQSPPPGSDFRIFFFKLYKDSWQTWVPSLFSYGGLLSDFLSHLKKWVKLIKIEAEHEHLYT